jgi:hypothetical protein
MMQVMPPGPKSVDEIGLIRAQLAAEQTHLAQAAQALTELSGQPSSDLMIEFIETYSSYLALYARRAAHRLELTARLLLGRSAELPASARAALEAIEERHRALEAELAKLETPLRSRCDGSTPPAALRDELERASLMLLSTLRDMQASVEPHAVRHFELADWRRSASVSADSVLEERRRFAELIALQRRASSTAMESR